MEIIDTGELELKVLERLLKEGESNLSNLVEVLGKKHNSAITQPLNSLLDKGLIKITGEYKPDRGRPGSLYGPTAPGVLHYLYKKRSDFEEILKKNKYIPVIKPLYVYYSGLKQVGYKDPEQFILTQFDLVLSLFPNEEIKTNEFMASVASRFGTLVQSLPEEKQIDLVKHLEDNLDLKELEKSLNIMMSQFVESRRSLMEGPANVFSLEKLGREELNKNPNLDESLTSLLRLEVNNGKVEYIDHYVRFDDEGFIEEILKQLDNITKFDYYEMLKKLNKNFSMNLNPYSNSREILKKAILVGLGKES